MRRTSVILIIAAALSAPAAATAQVADHVSLYRGGGLGLHSYSSFGTGFGFSVGGWGASLGFSVGFGTGFLYNPHGFYRPFDSHLAHCWDDYWFDPYDPYYACQDFGPFWGPGYGWSSYNPWRYGFLGWPSPRYVRSHWYGYSPFWASYWDPFWGDYNHWYGPRYRRYHDYPGTRVVQRTPLYGPRYKEYPAPPVYVTDNGPERPVSRLGVRRGAVGSVGGNVRPDDRGAYSRLGGTRKARPRDGSDARPTPPRVRARPRAGGSATATPQARPRSGTGGSDEARPRDTRTLRPGVVQRPPIVTSRPDTRRPSTRSAPARVRPPTPIRSAPPRVRSRPVPRERIEPPSREAPRIRSTPSRRPSPTARSFPSRTPSARPAPSRTPTPRVRSAPSRGSTPKARPAPSRGSTPKARPAPSRAPRPKARAAPSRAPKPKARAAPPRSSGNKQSRPRRPARRPG